MSCRLWLMLILISFQLRMKIKAFDYLENCCYEKRPNTALHGYNDLHSHWISDFDCFTRCLTSDSIPCRSFEHWHHSQYGLCIRANISLTDYPFVIGLNHYVDYYEIDCREESQTVRTSIIDCSDEQLHLTIISDDIDPEDVLLGDEQCKPNWFNETHAQFIIHVDNCSLMLTNESIIGKLRWQSGSDKSNSFRTYERFFACRSNLYQRRLYHQTSTVSNSRNLFSMLPNHQLYDDEQRVTSSYRITLEWSLHNQSYFCPHSCYISLYSLINITLGDLSLISSKFLIDSCDLIALPPYTSYLQSRRLIYQGCSIDPTVINVPETSSSFSVFHFSFYLYHILKEPIPFEIQCKILQADEHTKFQPNIDCASSLLDHNHPSSISNNKRDYSYTLFRSLSIYVTRQTPLIEHQQDSIIAIATVHSIKCSLHAFVLLILYTI